MSSKTDSYVTIKNRNIGPDYAPYIVAEMSGNHNHYLHRALKIVEAAKAAGADAVKLQTYRANTITIDHDSLKDNAVTIRERDSLKQIRVTIKQLASKLQALLKEQEKFTL
jgi:sialic acid synthase SpsE